MIKIENYNIDEEPKTFLRQKALVSAVVLEVLDSNQFTAADQALIGVLGTQKTELKAISAVTDKNTLASAALDFDHPADTPVILVPYDQIKVYRSTTGISGTHTLLDTINIKWSGLITPYTDANEESTYSYKVSFYNSNTGDESSLSGAILPTTISVYALSKIEDMIMTLIPDSLQLFIKRPMLKEWINEWVEKTANALTETDESFNLTKTDATAVPTQFADLPLDCIKIKRVEISSSSTGGWAKIGPIRIDNVQQGLNNDSGAGKYYMFGNQLGFEGITEGYYRIWYYALPTMLDDGSDLIDVNLRPYRSSCVDWVLHRAFIRQKQYKDAADFRANFTNQFTEMKENVDLRQFDENYQTTETEDWGI